LIGLIMMTGVLSGYERLWLLALAIGSIGPLFSGLSNAYEALMNAHELFYPFAVIEFICMLAFLAGNVTVVLMGEGLVALVAVTSMTSMLRFLLGAAWANKLGMRVRRAFSVTAVRALLAAGLPFLLINGTHFAIQRMDVLYLSWTLTDDRIGIYAASSRLLYASLFLLAAVGAMLYPMFSRLLHEGDGRVGGLYARGTLVLFIASALMAQLFITLAPSIIHLLYGDAFAESVVVLRILAVFLPLFGIGLLASNVLMVSNAVWKAAAASGIALLVGVLLCYPFILAWNISGAALAVLVAEAVAATLFIIRAQRELRLTLHWRKLFLAAIAVAAAPVGLALAGIAQDLPLAILSFALSVFLILLFRVVSPADLRELFALVRGRRQLA
jgi:O-antigen/teichoic acid export membrane protein